MVGIFKASTSGAVATLAASFKSLKLSRQVSEDMPRRLASAVGSDMAASELGMWTSEGLQKSASSAAKLIESVSTPVSSEYHSSKNLTVLDGGRSSLWSTNRLSEMSIGSEMLRVSEPSSTSFRDLTGLVKDTASAVDVTHISHGGNELFPSAVETPSDRELEKTASRKVADENEIVCIVEAQDIKKTDQQDETSYPRCREDGNKRQDEAAENDSSAQIGKNYPDSDESGIEHRETSAELMHEALSDIGVIATQNAGYTEGAESKTGVIAERMTDDLEIDANTTSMQLSSEIPTASVDIAEDVVARDIVSESAVAQVSQSTMYEESGPVISSDSTDLKESYSEDLPAGLASESAIDVLSPGELSARLGGSFEVKAEAEVVEMEVSLDSSVAEHDHETYNEWPPLPSDEELKISVAELEPSGVDWKYSEDKDTALHSTSPQHDVSLGAESGTLAVGASEKILSNAAHLSDVDSMHRFK